MNDQIVYAQMGAAMTWMNFYHHFDHFITNTQLGMGYVSFTGSESLPPGPSDKELSAEAPCSIECMLPVYLSALGIDWVVDWDWQESLLRG